MAPEETPERDLLEAVRLELEHFRSVCKTMEEAAENSKQSYAEYIQRNEAAQALHEERHMYTEKRYKAWHELYENRYKNSSRIFAFFCLLNAWFLIATLIVVDWVLRQP